MLERGSVKDAAKFCAEIKMIRSSFAEIFNNLAAIHLDDISLVIEERDDDRAVQMLMATGSQDAKFLER